ncbi:MAG TPA: FAD-containing oxidoreductase [Deltaproteobacteria bacterium]|jgi:pyruvate/2-oxoglutarate dehydrogenase complex dihydrolipoamide dehydrogenase (E3) component|nr:FAD-containing oxidoreductase [Deltaproteobacteria bacterium]
MRYDAIIVGSGQAGTPFSYRLADHGWTVALVEKGNLGGTCINTGCTPTKTMIHRAQVAHYARNAARWGVVAHDVIADLPKIVAQKDFLVRGRRARHEKQIADHPKIRLYRGEARFTGPRQLSVAGEVLESDKIFINTGARPDIPRISGLEDVDYLTNETMLDLKTRPEHLLVLGGGYIGLEFGQMFVRFGSRVTVIHHTGQILSREDPEIAAELQRALEAENMKFLLNARTTRVEEKSGSVVLTVEGTGGRQTVAGSHLLVATGRRPNTDGLGLEKAGVETDRLGFVRVNGHLETNVQGIWALGDVKGGPAFTHISYNDYQIIYANLIEGMDLSTDHRLVPYCVFTDPQLAGVGMTEKEARAKGYRLKVGKVPMAVVARAFERDETAGLMKIVVDASNDRVLGATILGVEGGEVVHTLYTLMLGNLPYTLLKGAVYIHPTLTEGLWFLMEDVRSID